MNHRLAVAGMLSLVGASWSAPALACSISEQPALDIVADPADDQPPTTPALLDVRATRGPAESSCAGLTTVRLELESVDDRPGALGYRVSSETVDFIDEDRPLLPHADGSVWLLFSDTFPRDEEVRFDVQISAVDRAGNVSEALRTTVRHPAEGGCALAGSGGDHTSSAVSLLMLLVAMRARASVSRRTARVRG